MTWREENQHGATLVIVRHAYRTGGGFTTHRHEFAEVFWCESGEGVHTVNGATQTLRAGDVVFIRPRDAHSCAATGRDGMAIVNVSFPRQAMRGLAQRCGVIWPWHDGVQPLHLHLAPRRMEMTAFVRRFEIVPDVVLAVSPNPGPRFSAAVVAHCHPSLT